LKSKEFSGDNADSLKRVLFNVNIATFTPKFTDVCKRQVKGGFVFLPINLPQYLLFTLTPQIPYLLVAVGNCTVLVGPCHHGMARPQVGDRGTASDNKGSCE